MMSDKDFVHYQELSNRDPVVQQLCKIIFALQDRWDDTLYGLDLNEEGVIDGHYTVAEYIRHLEHEVSMMENDVGDFQDKIEELEHRLKSRTVAELLTEAANERDKAKRQADAYFKETLQLGCKIEELTEKMNTWTAISRDYN